MSKKINGNGEIIYSCVDLDDFFDPCEINFPNCNRKVTRKVTIKDHPCAGEQKICGSPSCLQEAKQRLSRKYKNNKDKVESGRNKKHRAA